MNKKILSLLLILMGFIIFGVYIWFAINYNHINGAWGVGIWLVSIGTFLSGVINFFEEGKNYD